MVAKFAVDVVIFTIIHCVVSKLALTQNTGGAFLVVAVVLGLDLLIREDFTLAPWTVLLWICSLNESSVPCLEVNITWSVVRPIFVSVAHLAVEISIWPIVIVEAVQLDATLDATETVLVVPLPIGSDHFLCLIDPALALGATVLVILLRLDHPGLDVCPCQHVVFIVIELAEVLCPVAETFTSTIPGTGLGPEVACIASLAVDFSIRALTACNRVQLSGAFNARETVLVEWPHLSGAFLRLEDFASTARAGVRVALLSQDRLRVHPALVLRLRLVAVAVGVAVLTEHLPLRTIEEGGCVEQASALEAVEAVLVEGPRLGRDALRLVNLPTTSDTRVSVTFFAFNLVLLAIFILSSWTPELSIANLAIDVIIRTFYGAVIV